MAFSPQGLNRLLNSAIRAIRTMSGPGSPARGSAAGKRPQPREGGAGGRKAGAGARYPGDYLGAGTIRYSPEADGLPDPGEIVWTWVPYREDHSQGKDRPVLVIGSHRGRLLALMLASRDRNNVGSHDEDYLDIGSGAWDVRGRPSEIKLDRVLQLDPAGVRREGAVLPRATFEKVAERMRRRGWR